MPSLESLSPKRTSTVSTTMRRCDDYGQDYRMEGSVIDDTRTAKDRRKQVVTGHTGGAWSSKKKKRRWMILMSESILTSSANT